MGLQLTANLITDLTVDYYFNYSIWIRRKKLYVIIPSISSQKTKLAPPIPLQCSLKPPADKRQQMHATSRVQIKPLQQKNQMNEIK